MNPPIILEIWPVGDTCAAECRWGGDECCELFGEEYTNEQDGHGIWLAGRCWACRNAEKLIKRHLEEDRLDNH
jgi:hypothetical protein